MKNTINRPITVPLSTQAHRAAQQLAVAQATPQKGKRAYLNALAVYAVHDYLEWLSIETDLAQSDSWHPQMQAIFDVADLVIPNIGKLECRPILPGETACSIPIEVSEQRIGYVAVQMEESLSSVALLGFTPSLVTLELAISDLKPLDALFLHLSNICSSVIDTKVRESTETLVNLSQWFTALFEVGWQSVESLLGIQKANLAFAFRGTEKEITLTRAKRIDLGMQLDRQSVALVVALSSVTDSSTHDEQTIGILLQVHPMGEMTYLPANLQLTLLSESGEAMLTASSRNEDNYIQLQFRGQPTEQFYVKVGIGDVSITQAFVI